MCKELEEELQRGKELAKDLAEHLENSGASKITIPIETINGCYIVEIRKTL